MFCATGNKFHGICRGFETSPSKNTSIYAIFSMLQEVIFICKKHKHIVHHEVVDCWAQQTNRPKSGQNTLQNRPPEAFYFFLVPAPGLPKPTWRPRVFKASCRLTSTYRVAAFFGSEKRGTKIVGFWSWGIWQQGFFRSDLPQSPFCLKREDSSFSIDGLHSPLLNGSTHLRLWHNACLKHLLSLFWTYQFLHHSYGVQHHTCNLLIITHGLYHIFLHQSLDTLLSGPNIFTFILKTGQLRSAFLLLTFFCFGCILNFQHVDGRLMPNPSPFFDWVKGILHSNPILNLWRLAQAMHDHFCQCLSSICPLNPVSMMNPGWAKICDRLVSGF